MDVVLDTGSCTLVYGGLVLCGDPLALGVCRGARVACLAEEWRCDYPDSYEPAVEVSCDGLDNDCAGEPDDEFGLSTDPEDCAFCRHRLRYPTAAGVSVESAW